MIPILEAISVVRRAGRDPSETVQGLGNVGPDLIQGLATLAWTLATDLGNLTHRDPDQVLADKRDYLRRFL